MAKDHKQGKRGLNIIIVGCGKVGASLTEQLYKEGHDITLVDRSSDRLQALTDMYDVMGIVGNGASYKIQREAGIDTADLMIAVTDSDELNLLCCTVAKRVGDCAAIARVRTPDYSDEASYLKEKLGLAMIINPEMEAANEITHVLSLPAALGVNSFAHGQAQMIRFKIPVNNRLDGQKVMAMARNISGDVLVCAVEREKQVFIPDGNFELHQGDVVSFIAASKAAKEFFERIGMPNKPVHNTMIIGGGKAAYYLGKMLIDMGIEVKIIEIDRKRCRELSELLPQATIINGDGTDEELLNEEEIAYVDSLVPLTGIDEENVLLALHAREVSDAKVITKVNRNAFHNLIDKLDLGSYSRGMGALGLPGDLSSSSRFVRAAFVKMNALSGNSEVESVNQVFHIMGSVEQQRGCCEVSEGHYEITIYTACMNVSKGIYYYTTYTNHQITAVDMQKENLNGEMLVRYPMLQEEKILIQN